MDADVDTRSSAGAGDEPSGWLEIEEASPFTGKKTAAAAAGVRRWSSVVNATLVVLIMTAPPLLVLLGGGLGAPAVWIKSTVAGIGSQSQRGNNKVTSCQCCGLPCNAPAATM